MTFRTEAAAGATGATLEEYVAAFEAARAKDAAADPADFLPPPDDPLRLRVLCELVRIDLEFGWERDRPRPLAHYQAAFPALFQDSEYSQGVVFEEYRLRLQAGERPARADYARRFGVATDDWPEPDGGDPKAGGAVLHRPTSVRGTPSDDGLLQAAAAYRAFRQDGAGDRPSAVDSWCASYRGNGEHAQFFRDLHRSNPDVAERVACAVTAMPEPGQQFLGFRLITELGRGAFARVYLAEQAALANRLVALKVSTDLHGEPQTLAQLQHTNIVPVYSVHRAGPFQAVCMPYFGGTTLAAVLQDIESRQSLPASGRGLVSTLHGRHSTARVEPTGRSAAETPPADAGVPPRPEAAPAAPAPKGDATAVLRMLEGLTYVEAVLWLATRLADGLAHAHDHGILHRDLKPANVLLTDQGQPMLLDFNLSQDTKPGASAAAAAIGGTLPYMAPEHLEAFRGGKRPVDARSDLYALGVILFQLLTQRYPFPTHRGPAFLVLPQLLMDRLQSPPRLRRWNPAVSPAVEAVVRRCLEPDPAQRYQSAHELREDLERHRQDLPLKHAAEPSPAERLRKWTRRHPRLTSPVTLGAVAVGLALVVAAAAVYGVAQGRFQQARTSFVANARDSFGRFQEQELRGARRLLYPIASEDTGRREEGVRLCRATLDRFGVLDNPAWQEQPNVSHLDEGQRRELVDGIGEVLLLLARATVAAAPADGPERAAQLHEALRLNRAAEACGGGGPVPRSLWAQRAELARLLGDEDEARRMQQAADAAAMQTARDLYLAAAEHVLERRFPQALPLLEKAVGLDPQNYWIWYNLGTCHAELAQAAQAVACYTMCTRLEPQDAFAFFNRGLVHLQQRDFDRAAEDFGAVIKLAKEPAQVADAHVNRALARQGLAQYAEAVDDLTQALDLGAPYTRVYFLRARLRELAGDAEGAKRDLEEGLRREPVGEKSWLARGLARSSRDPEGALADFEEALKLNPRSAQALQNKAYVLSEKLGRTEAALAVCNRTVELYPGYVPARSGRGVLRARLGQRDAALEDARESLRRDTEPRRLYQVACIYALTARQEPDDSLEAFRLLSAALRHGYGFDLLENDPDLDPIRDQPEFRRLLEAGRALRGGR